MSLHLFNGNIPHLLFYGNVENNNIINEIHNMIGSKDYILEMNCAISKSIKNIREDIISFVKYQTPPHIKFKCVLLYDAEYLTIDAQYLLRRVIEIYSNNTRFIMITKNKDKLLKPIRSRFIPIYLKEEEDKKSNIKIQHSLIQKIIQKNDNVIEELYNNGIYSEMLLKWLKNKVSNYSELKFKYYQLSKIYKDERILILYLFIFRNNNII